MSAAPSTIPAAARSPRLPIIDQLREAQTEREAALLMLCLPLHIVITRADVIRRALDGKRFPACLDYLDNAANACRLVRKADPRVPGDMGAARVALALQHAGLTLQAAMDSRTANPPVNVYDTDATFDGDWSEPDAAPAFLDVGTER